MTRTVPLLPRPLVSQLSRSARRFRLRSLGPDLSAGPGRPLVVGFFGAPSGIGTGARLIFDALHTGGYDPAAADLTERFMPGLDQIDWRRGRTIREDDGRGPVIVHVNAPEAIYALSDLGAKYLAGRARLAYWAWEFERLPSDWTKELSWFHEVWAPSRFTAQAIDRVAGTKTVRAVGYPLAPAEITAEEIDAVRESLAAGKSRLVLHAYDARSSMDRKNPLGAIRAFRQGAQNAPAARLVLKATSWGWQPGQDRRILEAIAGDERIHLMTEPLSDREMSALIAAADIYLSPHRSEGFGLMLAGALLAGTPVIMTGWSGNTDFADLPGANMIGFEKIPACDSAGVYRRGTGEWAEPDIDQAARLLQEALREPRDKSRSEIAEAARDRFAPKRWLDGLGPFFWSQVQKKNRQGQ